MVGQGKKSKAFVIGDAGVAAEDREEMERRRVLENLRKQVITLLLFSLLSHGIWCRRQPCHILV
jgi:hypothetical protein